MSWQTYPSPVPTTQAARWEYTTPPPYPTGTTTDGSYQNYEYPTGTTSPKPSSSCIVGIDIKSYQAAIIALGVLCGLLFIGIAISLFFIFSWLRREKNPASDGATMNVLPAMGYQSMGRTRRRREATPRSRRGTEDMSDYSRRHRRSVPVTRAENEHLHPMGWANPRSYPAAFNQYPGPGVPLYYPSGQMPVNSAPAPPRQRGGGDEESNVGMSDVGSSTVQDESSAPHRHSSVRRHTSRTSRTSSSARGRSGRN